MKRSKVNKVIRDMEQLIREHQFELPDFAGWEPEAWLDPKEGYQEIIDNQLGWDITDFGLDDFDNIGFSLFTIRNGNVNDKEKYPKPYAEKLLMLYEGQSAPMHYHWNKMEDIINRGGNDLYIKVYNGAKDRSLLDTDVEVHSDGHHYTVPAGTSVHLKPGQSITIYPYVYHEFHVPKQGGSVLIGEVSMCNDDDNDNCFYQPVGRFPEIEEDEPPYRLLCNEYRKAAQLAGKKVEK